MKKPRIEDMPDKYEVLNPDGSFRCYGSETFKKLYQEYNQKKEYVEGKTYLLDITGICVEEDEIENTTIHVCRNGEWCEIPWEKSDIVGTLEEASNE